MDEGGVRDGDEVTELVFAVCVHCVMATTTVVGVGTPSLKV